MIDYIIQSTRQSTRTTLRVDVIARLPGSVTCTAKTVAATAARESELSSIVVGPGLSTAALEQQALAQREQLFAWLTGDEGTIARATAEALRERVGTR